MANCKDNCIHYKVCMYGDLTEYKTEQILKDDCDDFMPKDVIAKSEVEKIFDDIENNSFEYGVNFLISKDTFAELKKKYGRN